MADDQDFIARFDFPDDAFDLVGLGRLASGRIAIAASGKTERKGEKEESEFHWPLSCHGGGKIQLANRDLSDGNFEENAESRSWRVIFRSGMW